MKYLQDKLPPFSSKIVRARIEKRFGQKISDLFETFEDTPVAAASIAQVHKARLKSGEIVAVKILRPNIAQKYEEDIAFLEYGAEVITRFLKKAKRGRHLNIVLMLQTTRFFL